ncbi:Bug family tripartite tricarboxylate transporter substrate binding protein [Ottowia thiooxydans]|uniref:Bug family tripartite tricarboxylate transporter substrate binding protein n=1 Tax=Ottowia thiooxydans TaxID=219182 RepID=UPI0003FE7996|nr:tripartite tricarboxylate transporter substrate binding protein [Ottowia thiooxydans]
MKPISRLFACLAALAVPFTPALAADFPDKPVTIIVTFPPGGGTDLLARLLGTELQKTWKQSVVVENRAGASGNIGAQAVARSPADGYTLLMVNSSFAVNPGVFRKLPFDPKADFAPVINVAYVPSVFLVPPDSPYQNLKDMVAAAKSGRHVTFASCGNGTPQHLAGEMLAADSQVKLQHVPYRGCGPALVDLLGGQVSSAIVTASSAMQYITSGKARALGVTSKARSPFLPAVPSVAEQGHPGYELDQWHGLLAPANTPKAVIDKINADVATIVQSKEIKDRMTQLLYVVVNDSPDTFKKIVWDDIDRFSQLTNKMGLKLD